MASDQRGHAASLASSTRARIVRCNAFNPSVEKPTDSGEVSGSSARRPVEIPEQRGHQQHECRPSSKSLHSPPSANIRVDERRDGPSMRLLPV